MRGREAGRPGRRPGTDVLSQACVLIVDDHPVNVTLLERLVRSAGVGMVHGVTDPREAVDRCLEVQPDVVLLDLHMPALDGFAVMEALRAALPPDTYLPVVVLTADNTDETRDRALRAGATDFLTKPFDQTEVLLRMHNVLETRALYRQVQDHSLALQADLEQREATERSLAEEQRRRLERIDGVLDGDALTMVFQPVVDLQTGRVLGCEALARFELEPRRPPNEWFDEAASVGRGDALELAAVAAAVAHLDALPSTAFLAVNLSPATAMHPHLSELVSDLPGDRLVLELTEHARVDDYGPLLATIEAFREHGVRIAVDDAGAGYAGLRHILRLRPDILKLDLALTLSIDTDPARRALATAMVSFAGELGSTIIAEGIETAGELDTLRSIDVPWGQGYHMARPGPPPVPASIAWPPGSG